MFANLLRAILASLLFVAAAAQAQGPNETCLMCHGDAGAKGGTGKSIAVDVKIYGGSAHGGLGMKCTDCHTDASPAKLPHEPKLKPVQCASCHEGAVKQYEVSSHGKARAAGSTVAAGCVDCHGPTHAVLPTRDRKSRTNHDHVEDTCGTCHGAGKLAQTGQVPGGNVQGKYHDSIHGRLIHGTGSLQANSPSCVSCHGAHDIVAKSDAASRVSRVKQPETCGSCHQRAKLVYEKGKHGALHTAGNIAAPACADCHSAHGIETASKPGWQVAVIGQCGTCHADMVKSYRLTYHGKVTRLGFAEIATCASCHGAHDVRPASDPLSMVSGENRLETCRTCHREASAQFASWDPHPRPSDAERDVVLFWANIFMNVLLAGVFIFFGLHTVLWAYRSVGDVLRRRAK